MKIESIGSASGDSGSSPQLQNLYTYVEKKQWHKVKPLLQSPNAVEESGITDSTGLTFLGLCAAFSAPQDILRRVMEMHPQHVYSRDIYGATVLHIACLNGACLETVSFLINTCKDLVKIQDIDGRLPIHHAVECVCRDKISVETCTDVMKANIEVDPEILSIEDKNDCTVIDLIQEARCIENLTTSEEMRLKMVYTFLKKSNIQYWKTKKEMWERERLEKNDQMTHATHSSTSVHSMSHLSSPESDVSRFDVSLGNNTGEVK
jgi:hypothetical protein